MDRYGHFPVPKQIEVQVEVKKATVETKSPRLSPLRQAVTFQEVARPQSEERKRLTTETVMSSINTDVLSVIKEDSDDIPQCFEVDRCEDDFEAERQPRTCIVKLSESSFIEIFSIESKIDDLLEVKAPTKVSDAALESTTKGPKDIPLASGEPTTNLKNRALALMAVMLIAVYLAALVTCFGWFGLKTVQSIRHFATPAPRLISSDSFRALNATGRELWTEHMMDLVDDNVDLLRNVSETEGLAAIPVYLDVGTSNKQARIHPLVQDVSKRLAYKMIKPILANLMVRITIMLSQSASKLKGYREKRMLRRGILSSIQHVTKTTMDEVNELIDGYHYFI
jgi:hypothetical protein